MSHSVVQVEGTECVEPVLLWIAICMPTGSGKSALCKFLKSLVDKARINCGADPSWCLDDQSFEKMGSQCQKIIASSSDSMMNWQCFCRR